jgi:hypothetical protein
MMARAMAMRCFWPPLSSTPRRPHMVAYLCGRSSMKPRALDMRHASSTSWAVAPSLPHRMLSWIDAANRIGSCRRPDTDTPAPDGSAVVIQDM